MLREIFQNLLVTAICSALLWSGKKVWKYLSRSEPKPSKHTYKNLNVHFFVGLILLVVFIIVFCTVPASLVVVRAASGLFAGLSFLSVWGSFEEAMRFYPRGKAIDSEESEENAGKDGNN